MPPWSLGLGRDRASLAGLRPPRVSSALPDRRRNGRAQPISEWPFEEFLVRPGENLLGPDGWEEIFGRPGLMDVEVGFGKDEFLLDLAERRLEGRFLAVDYSRPRTRSYLNKIAARGLRNVRVLLEHAAAAIGLCLADASVEEYYVLPRRRR